MNFFTKSLWIDEWYSNLTSLIISKKWIPLYDSGYWDGSYLFFHYLQAFIFKIFWYSPEISRILPFIFWILSLIFIYKISKIVFNNKVVAYSTIFITFFSYYYIVAITQARYYSVMIFLFFTSLYFILKFYKNPNIKSFFISINIIFFSIIFHVYLYCLLPIFLLSLLFLFFQKNCYKKIQEFFKNNYKFIFLAFINFIIFYTIMKFVNPWQSISSINQVISLANLDYTEWYIRFFIHNYALLFIITFLWIFISVFLKKFKEIYILLFSFWFPFFVISKYVFMYATRYVYFLIPLVVILWIWIIYILCENIKSRYLKFTMFFMFLFFSIFWIKFNFDFQKIPSMNDIYAPEPNFSWAYKSILQDTSNKLDQVNIVSSFPHMDYLYLWKSDYYIYIDETWIWIKPEDNFYIKNWKNIFTNAQTIFSVEDLKKYEWNKKTYIILEQVSLNRLRNTDILKYIKDNYKIIFRDQKDYNIIEVYKNHE